MDKKKKWQNALMYNLFVMPGAGQISLGNKRKGFLLIFETCFFIFYAFLAFARAWELKLTHSNPTLEIIYAIKIAWAGSKTKIILCLGGIIIVWVYGIYDIYAQKKNLTDA